jgi:hypothetical protein
MPNLSRRHLVTTAAALPALAVVAAVPAVAAVTASPAAAPIVEAANIDAELIALGERLKVAIEEADRLGEPVHRLYRACRKAARFEDHSEPRDECFARFDAKKKDNGYGRAYKKWNAASNVKFRIARAILKIPSNSRVGDGICAMAAIVDEQDMYSKDSSVLWNMAARAGFTTPPNVAKGLKRIASA